MPLLAKIEFLPIEDVNSLPVMDLANEYPTIEGDELNDLISSIEANGVREALVRFEGTLLDGRNRLTVANKVKLEEVPVREFTGTIEEAEDLIVDLNERRRHLQAVQRAYIADRHRGIVEARAKEIKSETGKFYRDQQLGVTQQSAEPQTMGETRKVLADKHNVNHRYVDNVKKIRQISEETTQDPDTSDIEARIQTPRARKASSVLNKLQKGNITMNDAMESVFGNPGQVTSVDDPVSKAKVSLNKAVNDFLREFDRNAETLINQGSAADCENVRLKMIKVNEFMFHMNNKYGDLECDGLVDGDENREYWDSIEDGAAEHGARLLAAESISVSDTKPCGCDYSDTEYCDDCR